MGKVTNEDLMLAIQGKCPECKQTVKDWEPYFGSFAPEWWETCREQGIDPATGHKLSCTAPQTSNPIDGGDNGNTNS